jgi:hypothetical protein
MTTADFQVVEKTRGHIDVISFGRRARLIGEMLVPGPGVPSYWIWTGMVMRWGENGDGPIMTDEEKKIVFEQLRKWSVDNQYPIDFS